jgi:hypothetical protein
MNHNIAECLRKARTAEPDKSSLGNGYLRRSCGLTDESGVFCAVLPRLYNKDQLQVRQEYEVGRRRTVQVVKLVLQPAQPFMGHNRLVVA